MSGGRYGWPCWDPGQHGWLGGPGARQVAALGLGGLTCSAGMLMDRSRAQGATRAHHMGLVLEHLCGVLSSQM